MAARKRFGTVCQPLLITFTLLNARLALPSRFHVTVGDCKPHEHKKATPGTRSKSSQAGSCSAFVQLPRAPKFGRANRLLRGMSMSSAAHDSVPGDRELTICTWNVNSINKRLPSVLRYLEEQSPDLLALQEIKCQDMNFPVEELAKAGYHAVFHGQKSYNGVAILSREPLTDVQIGLAGTEHLAVEESVGESEETEAGEEQSDDGAAEERGGGGGAGSSSAQARYIEASWRGLKLCNLYLPNGNPVGTSKFTYRQRWTERLLARADALLRTEVPFVMVGDYNLVPTSVDLYDPKALKNDAVTHPECRHRFRALKYKGLYDAIESVQHGDTRGVYTYWGYRAKAWDLNNGLRIDHVLMEAAVADRLLGAGVHSHVRGWDTPSDHAPVWARVRW